MDWNKVATSPEVYAVLYAAHLDELTVHSSFSNPMPSHLSSVPQMVTEWGFRDSPVPLMGCRTEWEVTEDDPAKRVNQKSYHWLCIPIDPETEGGSGNE